MSDNTQYKAYVTQLLKAMWEKKGSDLFITAGFPPAMKLNGEIITMAAQPLTAEQTMSFVHSVMNEKQKKEFSEDYECNFAIGVEGVARFRINAFMQQGRAGMILRIINTKIPLLSSLGVPETLKKIIMEKRGLIIVVGATGSGKSTTLAAMIGHRNHNQAGHIITIEDPIEFVHEHGKSIVTQREVGVDTKEWENALKNTLRQAPDVILIGEIRDRETMEHAVAFAETGHLCLATLHANNSNQALDRIINFFPEERRSQLLMDLSLNLKSVVSQRLLPSASGGRIPAVEILLNTPYIQDLIFKGEVSAIKEAMKKGKELGMQTFDQAIFDHYEDGLVTFEDAMRNADSVTDLKLAIKLQSKRGLPDDQKGGGHGGLKMVDR
ncbi:PilT/PilU family type 4a pilus ATPase [archaeon]|nr:PilT/PilU family type 4a pilus ATPase [archaeon]